MILCQPSLNGLSFIFPPLYVPLLSFILKDKKKKKTLFSPLLSSNEVE